MALYAGHCQQCHQLMNPYSHWCAGMALAAKAKLDEEARKRYQYQPSHSAVFSVPPIIDRTQAEDIAYTEHRKAIPAPSA